MESIGYLLAVLMGLVLGLLGGGGSILTVPILVYFFGVSATVATGYSLLVVGVTSAIGAIRYYKDELIDFKVSILFAIPSMIGVLVARKYLLPSVPDRVSLSILSVSKDQVIMLAFAILVLVISIFMLKAKERDEECVLTRTPQKRNLPLIGVEGFVVGLLTGFVGAGGGFMIVPALILLAKVPLRIAIASSLVIISLKSLSGFLGDLSEGMSFDWMFLMTFIGFTMAGVLMGTLVNQKMPVTLLRKGFAYFVFLMGVLIVLKELV